MNEYRRRYFDQAMFQPEQEHLQSGVWSSGQYQSKCLQTMSLRRKELQAICLQIDGVYTV